MRFTVLECNLKLLQEKFEKLNSKCTAYGNETLDYNLIESFEEDDEKWAVIDVVGCTPKVEDCELVAVISKLDDGTNLVACVPGKSIPNEYRETDFKVCVHCHTRRFRKEVVIVQNNKGEYKQLGKTCLKDYLGINLEDLVSRFSWVYSLCQDAKEYMGERVELLIDPIRFLEKASVCVRKLGYVPTKDWDKTSTKSTAWQICFPRDKYTKEFIRNYELYVEDEDKEFVSKALEWLKDQPDDNDFYYNLKNIARQEMVGYKVCGYLAALIPSYYREVEKQKEEKKLEVNSEWVGEIKQRLTGVLECVFAKTFENEYSQYNQYTTLLKFLDGNNIIVWFASGDRDDFNVGDKMLASYTVKKHDEYKDKKQTIVNRLKVVTKMN